jgi:hypothetical protein
LNPGDIMHHLLSYRLAFQMLNDVSAIMQKLT